MFEYLVKGFLLGLSLSGTCLATCGPIYAPYMLMEKRSFIGNLKVAFQISVGRFITYGLFGIGAGVVGKSLSNDFREYATAVSYIALSIFLLFYMYNSAKPNHKECGAKKMAGFAKGSPLLLGIITGISFCPSFLIALTGAFERAGAFSGLLFFTAFFFGTTIIILPISFIGFIPYVNLKQFKKLGSVATIAVVLWFSYTGVTTLYSKIESKLSITKSLNFIDSNKIFLISSASEELYSQSLQQNLLLKGVKSVEIIKAENHSQVYEFYKKSPKESFILITANSLSDEKLKTDIISISKNRKLYSLEIDSPSETEVNPVNSVIKKLDFFNFNVKNRGFFFSVVYKEDKKIN
jgi:sulfite exporter TauE/SafE